MLILLPPSEGKTPAGRGKPLNLETLAFPELAPTRRKLMDALVDLCRGDTERARGVLGLPPGLADLVLRNAGLPDAPTARADRVYTGVLYDSLGLPHLPADARRRAATRVAVVSALFGLVRPSDRIPAYRLSGDVSLPGVGPVASLWREALDDVVPRMAGGLVVDLRSTTYAGFWRPSPELAGRVVSVRVLHETDGRRTVVSHFNKATKGRIVRDLLVDGATPGSVRALAAVLERLGWTVEVGDRGRYGTRLDVVVTAV